MNFSPFPQAPVKLPGIEVDKRDSFSLFTPKRFEFWKYKSLASLANDYEFLFPQIAERTAEILHWNFPSPVSALVEDPNLRKHIYEAVNLPDKVIDGFEGSWSADEKKIWLVDKEYWNKVFNAIHVQGLFDEDIQEILLFALIKIRFPDTVAMHNGFDSTNDEPLYAYCVTSHCSKFSIIAENREGQECAVIRKCIADPQIIKMTNDLFYGNKVMIPGTSIPDKTEIKNKKNNIEMLTAAERAQFNHLSAAYKQIFVYDE